MAKRNTKQVIIEKSLELFSQKGYDWVSVKEIAEAVGIKDSSLYKHFPSKQAIFTSILDEMNRQYEAAATSVGVAIGEPEQAALVYEHMSTADLQKASISLFQYYLHDPYAARVRRMLTIEQFKSRPLALEYLERYINIPLHYQAGVFKELQTLGVMRTGDPRVAAMQFYGPIYLLLAHCDTRPEEETAAIATLVTHVEQFAALYMVGVGE